MVFPESLFSTPGARGLTGASPLVKRVSGEPPRAGELCPVLPLPAAVWPRKGLPAAFGTGSGPPFIF